MIVQTAPSWFDAVEPYLSAVAALFLALAFLLARSGGGGGPRPAAP